MFNCSISMKSERTVLILFLDLLDIVEFLPFGRFFLVKRHKFYTLGRSRFKHKFKHQCVGGRCNQPTRSIANCIGGIALNISLYIEFVVARFLCIIFSIGFSVTNERTARGSCLLSWLPTQPLARKAPMGSFPHVRKTR